MTATPAAARRRFYCDNFIDLMGEGLAPELRAASEAPVH